MKQFHKNKSISIKWKIFGSLLVFIAIIILILWLFQVFFLENFYMYIKAKSVREAATSINEIINDEDFQTQINTMSQENEFCVLVFNEDEDIPVIASNNGDARCGLSEFSIRKNMDIINNLREEAKQNGTASELLETNTDLMKNIQKQQSEMLDTMLHDSQNDESKTSEGEQESDSNNDNTNNNDENLNIDPYKIPFDSKLNDPNYSETDKPNKNFDKERAIQSMTYISVVTTVEGTLKTIVINAQLSPVSATIETIQTQFFIIAGILIIVAMLVALYLSRKIALPIIHISDSAKHLAVGDYDVLFNAGGYLEVRELNDILNYAARELSKVEGLRRELIANMSHDLRTPLTMITGYGEVMRDIPGENTSENLQIVIDETKRLTNLVNDMLDLSKLQAGEQELKPSIFNLTEEVNNIIGRYDKLLTTGEYHLIFEKKEDVNVEADLVKIEQVIYNFINNAINYCGEDHVIHIRQTVIQDEVKLEIIDHGPGIGSDQLPYIWERYYKVDKTHVRSKVGSGLGLSIVRSVLELHQAAYGVESELGKGTTFWFKLPIEYIETNET